MSGTHYNETRRGCYVRVIMFAFQSFFSKSDAPLRFMYSTQTVFIEHNATSPDRVLKKTTLKNKALVLFVCRTC